MAAERPPMQVLIRGEQGEPLACRCQGCGNLTVNTTTQLCVRCHHGDFARDLLTETLDRMVAGLPAVRERIAEERAKREAREAK